MSLLKIDHRLRNAEQASNEIVMGLSFSNEQFLTKNPAEIINHNIEMDEMICKTTCEFIEAVKNMENILKLLKKCNSEIQKDMQQTLIKHEESDNYSFSDDKENYIAND